MREGAVTLGPQGASARRKSPVVGCKHYDKAKNCLNCAQSEIPGGQNLYMKTVLIMRNPLRKPADPSDDVSFLWK